MHLWCYKKRIKIFSKIRYSRHLPLHLHLLLYLHLLLLGVVRDGNQWLGMVRYGNQWLGEVTGV